MAYFHLNNVKEAEKSASRQKESSGNIRAGLYYLLAQIYQAEGDAGAAAPAKAVSEIQSTRKATRRIGQAFLATLVSASDGLELISPP